MGRIVNIDEYAELREQAFCHAGSGDLCIPNFIELTKCRILNRNEMEVDPIVVNINNIVTLMRDERQSTAFEWQGGSTLVLNGNETHQTLNVFEAYAEIISLIDKASRA